ncbi:L,D-transpeptidase [Oricola sp.]|uniref:L,D-transpeptidase n=1 Tax=Oricola sp. TaxID=1979950 RepID=UPI0035149D5E
MPIEEGLPSGSQFATRRRFLTGAAGVAALAVAGCTTTNRPPSPQAAEEPTVSPSALSAYRAMPEERFPIPAVDPAKIPRQFRRQQVRYPTSEAVGTVIVDTSDFYLYLVQENGMAMRYGCGLGRAGFEWSGRAKIAWKQVWPKWTPPDEMIARQPELEKWSAANGGMPPGPMNPLGARALYIFEDGVDTLYRVHGSPEYWSIGKSVSSGCVRLIQQDVIDLYARVTTGSPILVT